jgi:hypothetical protein
VEILIHSFALTLLGGYVTPMIFICAMDMRRPDNRTQYQASMKSCFLNEVMRGPNDQCPRVSRCLSLVELCSGVLAVLWGGCDKAYMFAQTSSLCTFGDADVLANASADKLLADFALFEQ